MPHLTHIEVTLGFSAKDIVVHPVYSNGFGHWYHCSSLRCAAGTIHESMTESGILSIMVNDTHIKAANNRALNVIIRRCLKKLIPDLINNQAQLRSKLKRLVGRSVKREINDG